MTFCNATTKAATSDHPTGTASVVAGAGVGVGCAAAFAAAPFPRPPSRKQAAMSVAKASVFRRLVSSCERLPQRTPRHCRSAKATVTAQATQTLRPASDGTSVSEYSPMTTATMATVPHVESQSLQPTMKAGYSPSARRTKTYQPPDSGVIVPSSDAETVPSKA